MRKHVYALPREAADNLTGQFNSGRAHMAAYTIGVVIGALAIPLIGLTLLIVGLVQRTRRQPPPPGYGPYPPQGYPPYPPGAQPPYYYPQPGQWPPPRPKPRGTGLIIAGSAILVLSLLGGVVRAATLSSSPDSESSSSRSSSSSSSSSPSRSSTATSTPAAGDGLVIGDCVLDSEFTERNPEPSDCEDPRAVMELVSKGGANAMCPDGKRRDDTDYTTLFWDDETLCFAANFIEGECYSVNTVDMTEAPFAHRNCVSSLAQVKVVQRFDGTTDDTRCRAGSKPISYVQPARLYCLEPAR
ncbi:LppU/SCO3897 family protein [Mycobacterium deserti]|uniref:Uncharacterized protein n=1 Tax=Mycobacterium deserti TaxID=2978347 RepID=A0ABT2MFC9_9MYCO|nr:hypothetical protein [Mycobacterium deserti]MCT7660937.1 hypothetical protein [Mycobacterium deserti]